MEHVLTKNFVNFEKGKNVRDILGDFLGNGIFASDGTCNDEERRIQNLCMKTHTIQANNGNFIVKLQVACFPGHFFVRVREIYSFF